MSPVPAGGPGTYGSVAAAALAARDGLQTAAQAALVGVPDPDLVLVVAGYYFPQLAPDQVLVEFAASTVAEPPAGPRQRAHHDLQLVVTIDVERVTNEQRDTIDRALQLLAALETHLRTTARTLDGAVLWCVLSESRVVTTTDETSAGDGCVTELQATFDCRVVVTT